MKKVSVLIAAISLLVLVACGNQKVHENVNEGLANDSLQAMTIINNAIKSDITVEELEESKLRKLFGFQDKYHENDMLFEVFNEVDEDIITFTLGSISKYANSNLIESDVNDLMENVEAVELMIKNGKPYLERKDPN